jgi:hypothetical protein
VNISVLKRKKMNRIQLFWFLLVPLIFSGSCQKAENDETYPVIDMAGIQQFPHDCDTLFIGEFFAFRAKFSDNKELGAYSIDIHQNFNHHSHSSSAVQCSLDPVKTPVNPYLLIREYAIPAGSLAYQSQDSVFIPSGVDPGDYHMLVRLTDRAGWQTIRGISVKLIEQSSALNQDFSGE